MAPSRCKMIGDVKRARNGKVLEYIEFMRLADGVAVLSEKEKSKATQVFNLGNCMS